MDKWKKGLVEQYPAPLKIDKGGEIEDKGRHAHKRAVLVPAPGPLAAPEALKIHCLCLVCRLVEDLILLHYMLGAAEERVLQYLNGMVLRVLCLSRRLGEELIGRQDLYRAQQGGKDADEDEVYDRLEALP